MVEKWGTVNKSELILSLSEKFPGLGVEDMKFAVDKILEQMSESLVSGKRIEIRRFGSFVLHYHAPRISRNPKTGEKISTQAKYIPHFKPGIELRNRVNKKEM